MPTPAKPFAGEKSAVNDSQSVQSRLALRRYESVAAFIEAQISTGTLPIGAKVPSLRSISTSHRVSVTTALAAYRLLECRGILEARSQSGFYVCDSGNSGPALPSTAKASVRARKVDIDADVAPMLAMANDPTLAPLACAVPSPELLASSKLDRYLARAARERGKMLNAYASLHGDEQLRQSIARRSLRYAHAQIPDNIIITNGCTEALYISLASVCSSGDTVAVETPTYFGLLAIFERLSLRVIEIPTDADSGIDIRFLQTLLENKTISACVLSSSFNNPLGCLTPDSAKREILDTLNKASVPLIEDDLYGDIYFAGDRPRPFSAFDNAENIIYCSSFSKTIAPGYRLGWVCGPAWTEKMLQHRFALSLSLPTLTQAAMADFLHSGAYDNHLRKLRRTFAYNVTRARQVIGDSFPADCKVSRPSGGFTLWVELHPKIDTKLLLTKALEHNICFAPGELFSASRKYQNFLRLSCGYDWSDKLEKAIIKLGELVYDVHPTSGQPQQL